METIGDLLVALRALESGKMNRDIYVPSSLRKRFLIEHNNKFMLRGDMHEVIWENMGSGVWKAKLL